MNMPQIQTRQTQESSNALNIHLQKFIGAKIQEYDEITNRNNQHISFLVNSNQVDSGIVKTVSNLSRPKKTQIETN